MWLRSCLFLLLVLSNRIFAEDSCETLLDIFATQNSNFTSCVIKNSRPITMCENCVQVYINIQDSYQKLSNNAENKTKCIDYFIHLDRLEIIQTQLQNINNLWDRAKCSDCYTTDHDVSTNRSEKLIRFTELHDKFDKCVNQSDINNTTAMCSKCMEDYIKLDNYYRSITDENLNIGVCMDIVDIMNKTRIFWSPKCCAFRKHEEYVFIVSAISVILLTMLFYTVVRFCAERRAPTILQQSRFAQFLKSNDCIINQD